METTAVIMEDIIFEAFLLVKIPVTDLEMTTATGLRAVIITVKAATVQATAVMGLERVVAVVATKVAQVMDMDLRAVVAMGLALDPWTVMGRLAVAIMVEVMDQAVMVPHTKVDRDLARPAAMDPQAVVATAAVEAAQTEAMAVVAPVMARTVDPLQVAVMGLEPVGAMDMIQLAATEVLVAAAMEQADLPAAVAMEQVQVAVAVTDPVVVVVAATVKAIRCQTRFSLKAMMFLNVWQL